MANSKRNSSEPNDADRNPDPITDAPGAHPVGVGIGAAAGGAAAGAAAGAVGGPVGAAVGAVVGAVAGGYAGKAVAESIDPTAEEAYWRDNYQKRPYHDEEVTYDQYGPAYRYGWEAKQRYPEQQFEDVEPELAEGWQNAQYSDLDWQTAKPATRDAWERIEQAASRNADSTKRKPR